jgi:hypothetical protein
MLICPAAHGMRTIDVLRKWCNLSDPEVLASEVIRFETAILESAEEIGRTSGKSGIEVLPGVAKLLEDLSSDKEMRGGEEKWAICTSCRSSSVYSFYSANHFSYLLLRRKSHPHRRSHYSQDLRYCRLCHPWKAFP